LLEIEVLEEGLKICSTLPKSYEER
jgi:hypothetical protein